MNTNYQRYVRERIADDARQYRLFMRSLKPKSRDLFAVMIAHDLGIHRDQLRGYTKVVDDSGATVICEGHYRKFGQYFEFAININTGQVLQNEVQS